MPRLALKTAPSGIKITLDKEVVTLRWDEVALGDVHLDPENPRIRHLVEVDKKRGKKIDDEHLHALIWDVHGVEELAGKLRDNGGTLDPIWLRDDGIVVEGNCRTVAYRYLNTHGHTKGKFPRISAYRLPKLNPRKIDILLGILHVQGKIQWRPYEKAGHIHRLVRDHGLTPEKVAQTFKMGKKLVEANIGAYELMRDEYLSSCKDGDGLARFSYFLEFYKDPKLEDRRAKKTEREAFVTLIKSDAFPSGAAVRKYRDIVEKPAALKKLQEGKPKKSFEEAMKIVGKTNPTAASKLVRDVEKLAAKLKNATKPELDNFKSATGRKLLDALKTQVENVATIAKAGGDADEA